MTEMRWQLSAGYKRVLQALGWLSVVTLARFWPWFISGKTLFYGDLFSLFVPGKLYSAEWLMKGETPYWNPHVFGGISWWGDISQSVAYPSTWLFGLVAPAQALMLTLVSHWWLLLVGGYLVVWSRLRRGHYPSLIATILFAATPPVTSLLHNLPMLQTVAWWPWVTLAALQTAQAKTHKQWLRSLICSAAVVAVQWYAGYPTIAVMSLGVATLALLLQSVSFVQQKILQIIWWGIAVAVGTVWAAPVLWPFIQTLLSSTRMMAAGTAGASIQPAELIKLVFPFVFELPWLGVRWGAVWTHPPTPMMYLGTLFIAMVGIKVALQLRKAAVLSWLGIAGVAIFLSLVSDTLGLSLIRVPVVWQVLAQWSVVMVLLLLIEPLSLWWNASSVVSKAWTSLGLRACAVLFGICVVVGTVALWQPDAWWGVLNTLTLGKLAGSGFHTTARDQLITITAVLSLVVLVLSAVGSMLAWRLRSARGLFLTLALELLITSQLSLFFMPPSVLNDDGLPPRVAQTIGLSKQQGWRVLTRSSNAAYADLPGYWEALAVRAPFSDSFIDPFELRTGTHLTTLKKGLAPNWHQLEGVSSIKGYGAFIPDTFQTLTNDNGSLPVNALPNRPALDLFFREWSTRYYIVDRWYDLTHTELNELISVPKLFDDGRWQVFELPAKPRVRAEDAISFNLDHFSLTANTETAIVTYSADQDLVVTFADRLEPGWSVTVDGVPATAIQGQDMKAVVVTQTPTGQSYSKTIQWRYYPPGLEQAQNLVLLSLVLVAGVGGIFLLNVALKKPSAN